LKKDAELAAGCSIYAGPVIAARSIAPTYAGGKVTGKTEGGREKNTAPVQRAN